MDAEQKSFAEAVHDKRIEYGISQNALAVAASVSRQYISNVETGSMIPKADAQAAILHALESYNPENPIEILFDYVRIRFPTNKIEHVIEDILRLKMKYMLYEEYAFYGYTDQYVLGDIVVMGSFDIEKGTLVELKGKGCRQLEVYLLAQHRSWYDFFKLVSAENGIFKRIDIAINDRFGMLDIEELTDKCTSEECVSVFRHFRSYQSGSLIKKQEQHKQEMGRTLYIGSLKSDVYFCLYQKDYEQFIKNNVPIEDAEVKNRFEIRLKNDRAFHAMEDIMQNQNVGRTAFGIINRYIRFVDAEDDKKRNNWKLNQKWLWFIGCEDSVLKLTTKPEPYSFERTMYWLSHQVAPTLKLTKKLDEIYGTNKVENMIKQAKLQPRHKKILEQQSAQVNELIIEMEE